LLHFKKKTINFTTLKGIIVETKGLHFNIKRLRELKGYTRDQVAAEMNMTVSGYSKIERGEVDPGIGKLERLAEIIGVNLLSFLHLRTAHIFYSNTGSSEDEKMPNTDPLQLFRTQQKYIDLLEKEVERLNLMIEIMRDKEKENLSKGKNIR